MSTVAELTRILKKTINVLHEEKEALIKNEVEKVAEILDTKTKLIEELKLIDSKDLDIDGNILGLVEEINSLQETNLLLTNQALSYQETLMESIAKNAKNLSNTYSAKGGYNENNDVNFIDKSI